MYTMILVYALSIGQLSTIQTQGFTSLKACEKTQATIVQNIEDSSAFNNTGALLLSAKCYKMSEDKTKE